MTSGPTNNPAPNSTAPLDLSRAGIDHIPPTDPPTLGRTLVLAPHPDDESLGCGGTLALLRQAGQTVHVVFISDGTLSHPNSPSYPADRLRDLRESEALAALVELGMSEQQATFFRLPDRQVPGTNAPGFVEAVDQLLGVVGSFEPDTILVPFERDPHPDHRATYQILQGVLTRMPQPPRVLEYLIWLWELGRPDELPRTGERRPIRIDVAAVTDVKKRAIAAHQSQVTRLIDDDPSAFYLSPELLRHFDVPYEIFLEKP